MTTSDEQLATWFAEVVRRASDVQSGYDEAFQHLENHKLLNRVVVHRYRCSKGCSLGVVISVAGTLLCRTRNNKQSRGLNEARSTPAARRRNTLDGERNWPGHTFDVASLAEFALGIEMSCRHAIRTIPASDVLTAGSGVAPGHPGKPTML